MFWVLPHTEESMVSRFEAHGGRRLRLLAAIVGVALAALLFASPATAQGNDDCLMCHEDPELVGERRSEEHTSELQSR